MAARATALPTGLETEPYELLIEEAMKGDPKVIQWRNIPETALLIHRGEKFYGDGGVLYLAVMQGLEKSLPDRPQ